jgi:hypothetical protein
MIALLSTENLDSNSLCSLSRGLRRSAAGGHLPVQNRVPSPLHGICPAPGTSTARTSRLLECARIGGCRKWAISWSMTDRPTSGTYITWPNWEFLTNEKGDSTKDRPGNVSGRASFSRFIDSNGYRTVNLDSPWCKYRICPWIEQILPSIRRVHSLLLLSWDRLSRNNICIQTEKLSSFCTRSAFPSDSLLQRLSATGTSCDTVKKDVLHKTDSWPAVHNCLNVECHVWQVRFHLRKLRAEWGTIGSLRFPQFADPVATPFRAKFRVLSSVCVDLWKCESCEKPKASTTSSENQIYIKAEPGLNSSG